MQSEMMKRASELLADGTVVRVLGWKNGEFVYDSTPAVFESAEALEKDFVYHDFCGSNLSKYLIKLSKLEGKTLVFLKPCDSYSFNQLLTEHRIKRENVYIIGIPCDGKLDSDKVREAGAEGILGITTEGDTVKVDTMYGDVSLNKKDCLLERCEVCKSHKVVVYDEMLGENGEENPESGRFDMVAKLEAMTPDERFAFWRGELSSAATPAATSARRAAVNSASLITRLPAFLRRPQQTPSKRTCFILFVHSTLQDAVQTAVNAPEYVRSTFRCIC
jgi:formate dehydrogenase subunit beta